MGLLPEGELRSLIARQMKGEFGKGVRLEQERVSYAKVIDAVTQLIRT